MGLSALPSVGDVPFTKYGTFDNDLSTEQQETARKTTDVTRSALSATVQDSKPRPDFFTLPPVGDIPPAKHGTFDTDLSTEQQETARKTTDVTRSALSATVQNSKPRPNFLIQMRTLVAEILTLLDQLRSLNSQHIEAKKQAYQGHSDVLKNNHSHKAWLSGIAAFVSILAIHSPNAIPIINQLRDAISSYFDVNATQANLLSSLILQELQKLHDNSNSGESLRNQLLDVLAQVREWLKAAVAHG